MLPGLCHSSSRAEIWALVMAVQWLLDYQVDGVIHVDSLYACRGAQFLQRTLVLPSDWCDRDLWAELLTRLREHHGVVRFRKVTAHLTVTEQMSEVEIFEVKWNSVADTNAKVARLSGLPPRLADVHTSLVNVQSWQKHWTLRCQNFLLELAQHSFNLANHCTVSEIGEELVSPPQQLYTNTREWMDSFPLSLEGFLGRNPEICAFGLQTCVQIAQWLLQLDVQSDFCQTVTFLEFFVGFFYDSKVDLPVRVLTHDSQESWIPVRTGRVGDLMGRSLQSRVAVFKYVFVLICKLIDVQLDWTHLSVPSIGIFKPMDALVVPWPRALAQQVSGILSRYTSGRPIRHSRDLARSWP